MIGVRWPGSYLFWCRGCESRQAVRDEPFAHATWCEAAEIWPLDVQIHGDVTIGGGVSICGPTEINGTESSVTIGDGCDIAAHVVINVADSHLRCIGRQDGVARRPIVLEDHVFVGSHAFIGGGWTIGHHSVVGAGVILAGKGGHVEPYSLVRGNPGQVSSGHYTEEARRARELVFKFIGQGYKSQSCKDSSLLSWGQALISGEAK